MNRQVPQLHVGHGTTFGALTVFPVWIDAPVPGSNPNRAFREVIAEF